MSRFFSLQTQTSGQVVLNVYDLNEANINLYPLGLGMYHSGVQVGGLEWSFAGGTGIYSDSPKNAAGAKFRESIVMGEYRGTSSDFDRVLDELRPHFRGDSYNILSKNCNSFSEALCSKLLRKSIPGFVNRMANLGSYVECCLPPQLTNAQGPGSTGQGQSENTISVSGGGGRVYNGGTRNAAPSTSFASTFSGKGSKLGGSNSSSGSSGMKPMAIQDSSSGDAKERARAARLALYNRT
jgi:hypothetical protein